MVTASIDLPSSTVPAVVGLCTFVATPVVPLPSAPEKLDPAHPTVPSAPSRHVLNDPALTSATVVPASGVPERSTSVGTVWSPTAPLASWPTDPRPQHATAPPAVRAQMCWYWLDRATMLAPSSTEPVSVTATGTRLSSLEPMPSWPSELSPQQATTSSVVSAQVNSRPAATRSMSFPWSGVPATATATGTKLAVVVPVPSSPDALVPQQYRSRAPSMPQAWV